MVKKDKSIAIIRVTLGQNNSQRICFLLLSLSTTSDLRTDIKTEFARQVEGNSSGIYSIENEFKTTMELIKPAEIKAFIKLH